MAGSFSVFVLSGILDGDDGDGYDVDREYAVTHIVGGVQYSGTAKSTPVHENDAYHNYAVTITSEEGSSRTFLIVFGGDDVPETLDFKGTEDGLSVYSGAVGNGTCTIKVGEKCQIVEFEYTDPTGDYIGEEVVG